MHEILASKSDKAISNLTSSFNYLNDAILLRNKNGELCYVNPAAGQILENAPNQLLRLKAIDLMPSFTSTWWSKYWLNLQAAKTYAYQSNFKTSHDKTITLSVLANLLEYEGNEYSLEILSAKQVNLDSELAVIQRNTNEYLKTLLDNFPFMVWLKDSESKLLVGNKAYAKVAGVNSTSDLQGKSDFDFFPSDLAQQYIEGDKKAMQSENPISTICAIEDAKGNCYWIESYKSSLKINSQVVGTLGYARDVTESLQKEREYQSLIENSPGSIVRFNKKLKRTFVNAKKAEFYEVHPEVLLGSSPTEFPGGASSVKYEEKIRKVFMNGTNTSIDLSWQAGNGEMRVLRSLLAPEFDIHGEVIAVISLGMDITETIENERRIHHLAYFDPLTNLPNRTLLTDRLSQTILEAGRNHNSFALIIIDLDRFKEINDALGHLFGDHVLAESSRRLEACVSKHDTVARLGGDEFAILVPKIRKPESVASTIRKIVRAFSEPFLISGKELFITLSIGIATFPIDSENMDELFKYADSALYYAKTQGRNNFQFYSKELTSRAYERVSLEASLRKALSRSEFELHYQPQVNLNTHEVIGVEALLRWNRNHNEMIPPDKFISIAEDSGLIIEIGEWVIYTACIAAVKLNSGRATPFPIAINLSSRQFIRNDLIGSIKRILIETDCKPEWLKLEITESLLLEDKQGIKKTLNDLNSLGFNIAIDDFGTGYSALCYLIHFPVNQIKIDRSFIQDITSNKDRGLLVEAIVSMSLSLRMNVIAEGVETIEQAEYLAKIGCSYAQGYLFGKPMPFAALSDHLGAVATQLC